MYSEVCISLEIFVEFTLNVGKEIVELVDESAPDAVGSFSNH